MTKLIITLAWLGIVAAGAVVISEHIAESLDNAANQIVAARVNS